jgi:phenylpyruvate tautomerase PptA (4-oxalocrotonate tautomerase family)
VPMLELTYPKGGIAPDAREELLQELATKMLEAEKAPDTEFFRSITWVYANEIEPEMLAVGGRPGGEPRFRVQVTVPEGALSDRRKGILVDSFNQAILRAAGLDESEGIRVWTLIREVPDGNWGAAGQQVRYKQLVEAAAAERDKAGAPA